MHIENHISISCKNIMYIMIISGVALLMGSVLKNALCFIPLLAFVLYLVNKKIESYIIFLVLWLYISSFYSGLGWINNSVAIKLMDTRYYIFFLFMLNIKRISANNHFERNMLIWIVFYLLLIAVRELVLYKSIGLGIVIVPYFAYIYFIIQLPRSNRFSNNFINLLFAIGILQLIVSIMQVRGIIPSAILTSTDLYAGVIPTRAGLDDVAMGTVGGSNQASWIGTMLFLFIITIAIKKESIRITAFSLLFLFQYATVDSKTLLGVTMVATILLLIKTRIVSLLSPKRAFILISLLVFGLYMRTLISNYYSRISDAGIDAPLLKTESSIDIIRNDIAEWGKIRGFSTIYNDLASESVLSILIGNNKSIYDMNSSVRLADNSIISKNNLTNSLSAFISSFSRGGILQLVMILWFLIRLYIVLHKRKYHTDIGKTFKKSGQVMLSASILAMFISSAVSVTGLSFIMIVMLFALVVRIEKEYAQSRNLTNHARVSVCIPPVLKMNT